MTAQISQLSRIHMCSIIWALHFHYRLSQNIKDELYFTDHKLLVDSGISTHHLQITPLSRYATSD